MNNRDDFSRKVKDIVAKRAAYICSNPNCKARCIGPAIKKPDGFSYIGIVAHITAASPKGPA